MTTSSTTSANTATLWQFSNDAIPTTNGSYTSTTVSTLINGATYFLYLSNTGVTVRTNSANSRYYYNNPNYRLRGNGGNYYLRYNNGWTATNTNNTSTYVTRTAVNFSAADVVLTDVNYTTVETGDTLSAALTVSTVNALNNVTFTADSDDAVLTFTTVNETVSNTVTPVSEKVTVSETDAVFRYIGVSSSSGLASGHPTYFPLRIAVSGEDDYDSSDALKPSQKNTGYIVGGGNFYDSSSGGAKYGDIRVSEYAISNINSSYSSNSGLSVTKIRYGNTYLYLAKDANDNYVIADTADADQANYWYYSNNKLSTIIKGTTYYLTYSGGLALSTSPGVDWTFSNNNRLAYNGNYLQYYNGVWTTRTTTQNLTLTLGSLTTVYTVDGSGNHALTSDQKTEVYQQAAFQFTETLLGSSYVYGLHFMNAEISDENLVTADYVSLFGQEYRDYELPEDSIDFNVVERGYISFFAGTYFTGNNAFFSLHQILRDGDQKITDIKEITEIYVHASLGDSKSYIYKYSDNTYSNADGSYSGAVSLDEAYNATPVFRTSWITNPTGVSKENKLYFFQIPCNLGEYCLGSVSGKTGAYLLYLDIATHGGDIMNSVVSSEGNEIIDTFKVEFRTAPDAVDWTNYNSVLLYSFEFVDGSLDPIYPDDVDPDAFSVRVSFSDEVTGEYYDLYENGMYTIDVVNESGYSMLIYVYLCDDDLNVATPFKYAYTIRYVNDTHGTVAEPEIVRTATGYDFWQACAGFLIPATGQAQEATYS